MVGVISHIQAILVVLSDGGTDFSSGVLMDTTRTLQHHARPTSCLWLPGLGGCGGGKGQASTEPHTMTQPGQILAMVVTLSPRPSKEDSAIISLQTSFLS